MFCYRVLDSGNSAFLSLIITRCPTVYFVRKNNLLFGSDSNFQIEEDQKLVNGQSLKQSLGEATALLEDEIRFLIREGPNLIDSEFGKTTTTSTTPSTSPSATPSTTPSTTLRSSLRPDAKSKNRRSNDVQNESTESHFVTEDDLTEDDQKFIQDLVKSITENRTVVSLGRTKPRLPGRNVILYGGAMVCLFTLAYK